MSRKQDRQLETANDCILTEQDEVQGYGVYPRPVPVFPGVRLAVFPPPPPPRSGGTVDGNEGYGGGSYSGGSDPSVSLDGVPVTHPHREF